VLCFSLFLKNKINWDNPTPRNDGGAVINEIIITSIPKSECEVELIFMSSIMLMMTPKTTPEQINVAVIIEYFLRNKSDKKALKKITDGHIVQNKNIEKGLTLNMLVLSPKEYNINPIITPTRINKANAFSFIKSIID